MKISSLIGVLPLAPKAFERVPVSTPPSSVEVAQAMLDEYYDARVAYKLSDATTRNFIKTYHSARHPVCLASAAVTAEYKHKLDEITMQIIHLMGVDQ